VALCKTEECRQVRGECYFDPPTLHLLFFHLHNICNSTNTNDIVVTAWLAHEMSFVLERKG